MTKYKFEEMKSNNFKKWIAGFLLTLSLATGAIINTEVDTKSNKLQLLILHCSATREGQNVTAKQIIWLHTGPKSQGCNGWRVPGYADLILRDGKVENLVKYNDDNIVLPSEITNGTYGFNRIARNVCYVGGMDSLYKRSKNTLTHEQDSVMRAYVLAFIHFHPDCYVAGHNQFAAKACPSFDVADKCLEWGVPVKNIFRLDLSKLDKKQKKTIENLTGRD